MAFIPSSAVSSIQSIRSAASIVPAATVDTTSFTGTALHAAFAGKAFQTATNIAVPIALSIAGGASSGSAGISIAGGSSAPGLLDIGRVKMRLEGLQAYGTLCALLTNGCLRLYSSVGKTKQLKEGGKHDKIKEYVFDAFLLCIIVAILFGSYTTIVFSLLALYSKTALGRGFDAQFLDFWAASAGLRESGFESFLYALVSFELAFILSLFLKFDGARRKRLIIIATVIALLSFRRYASIMNLASKYLFPLKAEVEY